MSNFQISTNNPILCPHCQTPNDPASRFCIECGRPLVIAAACPECGASNAPDARFCTRCGHPLTGKKPKTWPRPWLLTAGASAALLLLVAIGSLLLWKSAGKDQARSTPLATAAAATPLASRSTAATQPGTVTRYPSASAVQKSTPTVTFTPSVTPTPRPTVTPRLAFDPKKVFIVYHDDEATVWELTDDSVTKILSFDTDDGTTLGGWTSDYSGWEVVGGKLKGGVMYTDGTISADVLARETALHEIRAQEHCNPFPLVGMRWCETSPDRTELLLTKESDVYSIDWRTREETNWSQSGIFSRDIPLLLGWLDPDHILLAYAYDEDKPPFILGRDGTWTKVSDLEGFNVSRWDPALTNKRGYTQYIFKSDKERRVLQLFHVYASRTWKKIIEISTGQGMFPKESLKYYGYSEDGKSRIFFTADEVIFLDEQDNIQTISVPNDIRDFWNTAFEYYVDQVWASGNSDYHLEIKRNDLGQDLMLLYLTDVSITSRKGWEGIWMWNLSTGQVMRLHQHPVSRVFWLTPEKILFTVSYTIDGMPAPDLGTWFQAIGNEPVKLDTYRATSATIVPDTDEILFVIDNTLYKYDGHNTQQIGKDKFYDGEFYWPDTRSTESSLPSPKPPLTPSPVPLSLTVSGSDGTWTDRTKPPREMVHWPSSLLLYDILADFNLKLPSSLREGSTVQSPRSSLQVNSIPGADAAHSAIRITSKIKPLPI